MRYKVYKEGNLVIGKMFFMQFYDNDKVLRYFKSIKQNFSMSSILQFKASKLSNFLNSLKFNSLKLASLKVIEDNLSLCPINLAEVNYVVEIFKYLAWGKFISFSILRLGFVDMVIDYSWVNLLHISKA